MQKKPFDQRRFDGVGGGTCYRVPGRIIFLVYLLWPGVCAVWHYHHTKRKNVGMIMELEDHYAVGIS